MKKFLFPVLLAAALILSACGAETEEEVASCRPYNLLEQKLGDPYPGLPDVTDEDWSVGPSDARVTFMEYSEPQCPFCARLEPILLAVQERYPNDVRLVYRHRPFPESFHDKSILASRALEAAGKQGRFQEMKNFLFSRQSRDPNSYPETADLPDSEFWVPVSPDQFDEWLADRVPELGIDPQQFLDDMFSSDVEKKIKSAQNSADSLGINGTPTVFINGHKWPEQQRTVEMFSIYVELILNEGRGYRSCPEMVIDTGKDYTATLVTTKGEIQVELFDDIAPNAVNSFVFLANEGWYNDMHILVQDTFILTGDPSGTSYGGAGFVTADELSDELSLEDVGMLASFSRGPNLNGSAFFINKTALSGQEGRTIFGRVTGGMEVVESLEPRSNIFEPPADTLLSISISAN